MLSCQSINDFLLHREKNGASDETLRAYRSDLDIASGFIPPGDHDWPAIERYLAEYLNSQRKVLAPRTICRKLAAIRAWAKWAGNPTLLGDYNPPKPAPSEPHPIPEGIDGVLRMIRSTRNPRHRALCALTGLMGLRVSEAVAIKPDDFNLDEMTLRVRGKGDKTRTVPVSDAAWKSLEKAHALATKRGTTLVDRTERGARAAISRHARNAGLSRHVASHDMRATLATAAYEKTHDLRAVQELLGHADAKTTQTYTGVSMSARRTAIEVA